MRRLLQTVGITCLLAALTAAPAMAADQQVGVEDNAFLPPGVAVKPGEKVTWSYPGGGDHHNVHFEDNSFTNPPEPAFGPWSATRTFNTEGTFRYYCQEHGGPGGQGMSGIVYVNLTGTISGVPPVASFTVSASVARVGQSVAFDATGSTDPDSTIIRHEWDLNGDGTYELDTGALKTTAELYSTAGTRTVRLKVTDSQGLTSNTSRSVVVTDEPTASFTASPSSAQTGQAVSFNGSASRDPDGTIAKYEWDLDGNGSYETNTGATPTTSRAYVTPGLLTVKLRVTDDKGLTAETTRSLRVNAAYRPQPPTPTPIAPVQPVLPTTPAPAGCGALKGARRTACLQKRCSKLKGAKRASCIQKSCRSLKGKKRAACMLKSCRSLKGSKKRACTRKYARRK